MADRKVVRKVTQAEGFGFEEIGDSFEGVYESQKTVTINDPKEGKRAATLLMLQPDEGERIGVWANKVLEELMAEIQPGTYVRITHHKVGPKKGKNSPTKLFEVEILE